MTATREQIVGHFLRLPDEAVVKYNWGLGGCAYPDLWNVDDDTYINGVPLTVDLDWDMGWLIEVVERDTSAMSYLVVVTTPKGHRSQWWDSDAGTFFDRKVTGAAIAAWGAMTIHGLLYGFELPPVAPDPCR